VQKEKQDVGSIPGSVKENEMCSYTYLYLTQTQVCGVTDTVDLELKVYNFAIYLGSIFSGSCE
jgi:hypothetical protein